MIELKEVHYKETHLFKETEIHFNYNDSYGIYTILEFKPDKEVTHFISYNNKHHNNSRFNKPNYNSLTYKESEFIKAFNKYFDYQIR